MAKTIDITPKVGIIKIFRNLDYSPWNALAEYIDNSLESYLRNEKILKERFGPNYHLKIDIQYDYESFVIEDNAAGISPGEDFERAFKAAEKPPKDSKLSEFGMGLKAASTWYSDFWEVITHSINSANQQVVSFDIPQILQENSGSISINSGKPIKSHPYTIVKLKKLRQIPQGSTIKKIKEHLTSIYRNYINNKSLEIYFMNEKLEYEMPEILKSPYYKNPQDSEIIWKKNIDFTYSNISNNKKFRITGFVALLKKMSTVKNGFALFRNNRVIEGNQQNDENFKPRNIFGSPSGHKSKRLFGEIHLPSDFDVRFDKGGFIINENFNNFLTKLEEYLRHDLNFPILQHASNFRSTKQINSDTAVKEATEGLKNIKREDLSKNLFDLKTNFKLAKDSEKFDSVSEIKSSWELFDVAHHEINWKVHVECYYNDNLDDKNLLKVISNQMLPKEKQGKNTFGIRLSLSHPFIKKHAGTDSSIIQPIIRFAIAICLTEIVANDIGEFDAVDFRRAVNNLLTKSLN